MTNDQIYALIRAALSGGCGLVIQWIYAQYLESRSDGGAGITPFIKRWTMIGLCIAVPSVLYAFLCFSTGLAFDYLTAISYIGLAYYASQGEHSARLDGSPSKPTG